jgi:hypothetical protein
MSPLCDFAFESHVSALHLAIDRGAHHVVLRGKVAIEAAVARSEPRTPLDLRDGRSDEADLEEEVERNVEDSFVPVSSPALLRHGRT